MNKSLVSPSFLKQKARQIKREKSLSQSQSLDEAAKLQGFSNYKNYLNVLAASRKQSESSEEALLKSISLEKDISKKAALIISLIHKFKIAFQDFFAVLGQLQTSEEVVQSVCEKSTLKDDIQAAFLNYFRESKSDIQALPLKEHFLAKAVSVKDLTYEFVEGELHVSGNYDIEFEFEFEVPDEHKHLPHFSRDPMFGDFEVTIDKDKKMTFENPNIGEDDDEMLYMGPFKIGRF